MIDRINIGIFGLMNAGKSTLMNLLTDQNTSIVDNKRGTTTDIKISLLELHFLGPIKLFDTAGIDEKNNLGDKKKQKTIASLKEVDLILLVIDPSNISKEIEEIIHLSKEYKKQVLIIYNYFSNKKDNKISFENINFLKVDLKNKNAKEIVLNFLENNYKKKEKKLDIFPSLKKEDIVFLNIPMDAETPEKRLLRPQSFIQEHLLRRYVSTFCYRMDLIKARDDDKIEKERFINSINLLKKNNNLKLLITDSQAIDIIHKWTIDENKNEIIPITTFSVIMAYTQSMGNLNKFIEGIEALKNLKKNDRILIAEACNHNRIKEDIGIYQIPKKINDHFKDGFIKIDHAFGREFSSFDLNQYKLIIHCGGCMIDKQKMQSRLFDLNKSNVSITNYGLVLSYFNSKNAFNRVIKPFMKV
ncbi:MAG: tRNA modification GTPase MnmE [Candidatus Anoxychlamydiales bacterium]|nr:tRNA modification GTPase MnmE [Candidatus Anoxychlamydiales bacterium]